MLDIGSQVVNGDRRFGDNIPRESYLVLARFSSSVLGISILSLAQTALGARDLENQLSVNALRKLPSPVAGVPTGVCAPFEVYWRRSS